MSAEVPGGAGWPPSKIKLSRRFCLIPLDEERVAARTGGVSFTLQGKDAAQVVGWLIPYLDGRYTFEEILALPSAFSADEIAGLIATMLQYGIVEDAEIPVSLVLSQQELARYEDQLSFFAHFSRTPHSDQEKVKGAHVAIIGAGAVGAEVALNLALAGVGRVTAIDDQVVTEGMATASAVFRMADVGKLRGEICASNLRQINPLVQAEACAVRIAGAADIEPLLTGVTLALLCPDKHAPSVWRWMNEACLNGNITWTSARIDDFLGIIGPTVVPFETPCYLCYDLRRKSNLGLEDYEESQAYEKLLSATGALAGFSTGLLPPFVPLLASAAAVEALKVVTGFATPTAAGAVWEIDFLTLGTTRRPLLKVPRCPACGARRPAVSSWAGS